MGQHGEPGLDFHGHRVYAPFGIPAGPLLNSAYCAAAFRKGFDIAVYKTVRSGVFPCHPWPNVLAIHPAGDLNLEELQRPVIADTTYSEPLSITNSFGVPSKEPGVWQEDARKAIAAEGKGQVLVLSFMGTAHPGQTQQEFVDDYVLAAKLAKETGAKVLETNLSCPNIGNEGLVCYDLDVSERIARGIRAAIGDTPLILKVGYYGTFADLERLARIAQDHAHGVSGINTLQAEVRNAAGEQALPRLPGAIAKRRVRRRHQMGRPRLRATHARSHGQARLRLLARGRRRRHDAQGLQGIPRRRRGRGDERYRRDVEPLPRQRDQRGAPRWLISRRSCWRY